MLVIYPKTQVRKAILINCIAILIVFLYSCAGTGENENKVYIEMYDTLGKNSFRIALKGSNGKYVNAEYLDTGNLKGILTANKDIIIPSCIFTMYEMGLNKVCFLASNKKFVGKNPENFLVANADSINKSFIYSKIEMENNKFSFFDTYRNYVWVCNYDDFKGNRRYGLKADLAKPNGLEKFELIIIGKK